MSSKEMKELETSIARTLICAVELPVLTGQLNESRRKIRGTTLL
jgi:hypothetical protein